MTMIYPPSPQKKEVGFVTDVYKGRNLLFLTFRFKWKSVLALFFKDDDETQLMKRAMSCHRYAQIPVHIS